MANIHNQVIDKTYLSADAAEKRIIIHRDLLAHCLRWSHVAKFLHAKNTYKTAHILDVGCGREQPLARLLYSNKLIPSGGSYTGIDYNKLELSEMLVPASKRFPITLIDKVAFPDVELPRAKYDVIVCFEVLEHVEPAHSLKMLQGMRARLAENGVAFISTPCYDQHVGAAGNHVNEMSYKALGAMIEHAGLAVDAVYGTFASQRDYKAKLQADGYGDLFEKLSAYYDSNYLATIFAPLYPAESRNALWKLSIAGVDYKKQFPALNSMAHADHSSSAEWPEFAKAQ